MWSADVFTRACSRDRRMMPPEREKVRQLDHPCEIGPDCRESKGVRALHRHDEARYENFEQAKLIFNHLIETYETYGYQLIQVPYGTVEERIQFIFSQLS